MYDVRSDDYFDEGWKHDELNPVPEINNLYMFVSFIFEVIVEQLAQYVRQDKYSALMLWHRYWPILFFIQQQFPPVYCVSVRESSAHTKKLSIGVSHIKNLNWWKSKFLK